MENQNNPAQSGSLFNNLGETILNLRKERKLKQKDLADKISVAVGYVSQIETGKKVPSFDVLDRIAFALQIPVEHLIMKAGLEKKLGDEKGVLYRELKPFFEKMELLLESVYS